ncbi:PP2C family protein-serine/threonine phosphatase [Actinomadura verrucosospora]|uniref:protein-serine/threonine phosphatase n=1 Tax=Actinomadura verrucosospora TaxID=46165 RepID=A0A7D3VR57_ACTVE|nr:PP2C family protein-serine/threonine phosphatase [Actinomadura verrucosospora]QKG20239.1 magnesium or manganese-dependent protein phosphatase [Actinomadura verrucosospora]
MNAESEPAGLRLLSAASTRMAGVLDMERVARHLVAVALGGFADGAGVYVAEQLIAGDELPRPPGVRAVEARRIAVGAAGADLEPLFPAGEMVVFPAGTACAACLTDGTPQRFAELEGHVVLEPRVPPPRPARELLAGMCDFLLVPLRAAGTVLGLVVFARGPASGPFNTAEAALAEELAALTARCLDGARRYQREHAAARALETGLLPPPPGAVPGVQVAHRSVPAGEANLVGGDWCDIIPLPSGRIALVIGDAMGHGSAAAAAMVQLRAAARTLAMLGKDPAQILTWLDRIAPGLGPVQFATCACAVLDTASGTAEICRAGHPPPVLLDPGGGCDVLDVPPGLPLGLDGADYENTRVAVPDGSTLVLYTDGLIETRARDLEAGIAALLAALAGGAERLEDACAGVVDKLVVPPNHDDVTVMLVRTGT